MVKSARPLTDHLSQNVSSPSGREFQCGFFFLTTEAEEICGFAPSTCTCAVRDNEGESEDQWEWNADS